MGNVAFHAVGKLSELKEGEPKRVSVADREIALYNIDGAVYATDDTCTHAFASLSDGFVDGDVVECPLHGARFEIKTGNVVGPPADEPLGTYPTKVEGDTVYVGLPEGG